MTVDVRFGKPGYESPSGTWKVEKKTRNAWSYLFNVTLPFSLEYDLKRGIYIHYSQAWAEAGPSYPGSHGCVNIKDWATAEKLFNRVPVGTTVYVY